MKGLKGKTALITGASSGIGQAIAVRLAQEGVNVAINYRKNKEEAVDTQELIDRACEQIRGCGVQDVLVQADVAQEDEVVRMVETVIEKFGKLDILVNNAGIQIEGAAHEMPIADFDKVLNVNLRGAYLCARETIRHFLQRQSPGVIINISSVHELIPKPEFVGYSVSKGGMENLTRSLALEYADRQIRVNAIGPGATITPINEAWTEDPEAKAKVESKIPMKRAGTPEEMAAAVAFLVSEEAAYITGQTLFIDGGLTLYPAFQENWSS
jgi:glucose 1-dehydrogenase